MARPAKHCREATLEKATELFWQRGYRGVSIQDLVKETGVLAGSLYASFGNKDEFFTRCVHHYAEGTSVFYLDAEKVVSPLGQIEALFEAMIEDSVSETGSRGCFVVNSLLEIAPDRPEIAKVLRSYVAYSEGWIEERLKQAIEAGEIKAGTDALALAECLFGIVYGARIKARANDDADRIRNYVKQMLACLLDPVRVENQASA